MSIAVAKRMGFGIGLGELWTATKGAKVKKAKRTKRVKKRVEDFAKDERAIMLNLSAIVMGIVTLVIVTLVGVYISASIYNLMEPELATATNSTYGSYFTATISGVLKGFQIFGNFAPILILVFIAAVMIAVILAFARPPHGGSEF